VQRYCTVCDIVGYNGVSSRTPLHASVLHTFSWSMSPEQQSWLGSLSRRVIVVQRRSIIEHWLCAGSHPNCTSALPPLMSLLGVHALVVVNALTRSLKSTVQSRAVMILTIGVAGDSSFNTSNTRKHLNINHAEKWIDLLVKKEASVVDKRTPTTGMGIGCMLVSVSAALVVSS